jgi:geranylgeranyl diphosphate synthase type II
MVVLAYRAFGGRDNQSILRLAAATELLHSGLLIHDDFIDRDFSRYGRDNIAGTYRKKYAKIPGAAALVDHFAASVAVMAGDLMISAAHQFITQTNFSSAKQRHAMAIFGSGFYEVIGGEFLDTQSVILPLEEVDSLKIAMYKTATYSFITPLCLGAAMAGASAKKIKPLRLYGQNIGIAYQLVDDLLGLFGEESETGKPAFSDLREGKRTFLIQQALRLSGSTERAYILKNLGSPEAGRRELEAFRKIVVGCGALAYVEKQIADYGKRGLDLLDKMDVSSAARKEFSSFVRISLARKN